MHKPPPRRIRHDHHAFVPAAPRLAIPLHRASLAARRHTADAGLYDAITRPCTARAWLPDGTPVRIRPIRRSDLELERRFVCGLSARTRYLRLLSGRQLQPGELERWTDIDPAREIALIALVTESDDEREIAVARCALDDRDPPRWDFGIVVGDAWQGQGLGEAMLRRLTQCAEEAGVAALSSITLSENRRMLSLARRLGFSIRREAGDATLVRIESYLRRPGAAFTSAP